MVGKKGKGRVSSGRQGRVGRGQRAGGGQRGWDEVREGESGEGYRPWAEGHSGMSQGQGAHKWEGKGAGWGNGEK